MSRDKRSRKKEVIEEEEEDSPPSKVITKRRRLHQDNPSPTSPTTTTSSSSRSSTPSTTPTSRSSSSTPSRSRGLPFKNPKYTRTAYNKKQTFKNLKQILAVEIYNQLPVSVATYVNIEASPSLLPSRKYCDITGFVAPYKDPRSGMRYSSAEVYSYIKQLPDEKIQEYLGLRRAAVVLK